MEWALGKVGDELEPRDVYLLMAIATQCNVMTGAYFGRAKAVVKGKWSTQTVVNSVSRLKKAGLIKRFIENKTQTPYYACNPRVIHMGSDHAMQRLWQKWRSEAD